MEELNEKKETMPDYTKYQGIINYIEKKDGAVYKYDLEEEFGFELINHFIQSEIVIDPNMPIYLGANYGGEFFCHVRHHKRYDEIDHYNETEEDEINHLNEKLKVYE